MKKTGNSFKVPEGYFDNFTSKLLDNLPEEATITPKNEGFKIPDGYLENFNKELEDKLNVNEPKVIALKPYKKYYYAAASIAAAITIAIGLNMNTAPELSFDDLADVDIENYFDSNESSLSSYDIAEIIPVSELEIYDVIDNHLSNENVMEYLENNIDDFDELNIDSNE
ncbi:hypothetical protein Celal_0095 [Cellulophaga algicola DSM 14237]|uniref:Uncharacterized protein n=1 Tax=Cellulophaga algicola (strain DSM 14237 / IC166 / ACAM 630) TaxID=688270 RepID=E6X703_CELAD|nr:hypothetical protein [Cellulophaga algicola]ADV47452.1 hypothetical protein Celal_0095 [Cellulophaga algicola DSM 14237]